MNISEKIKKFSKSISGEIYHNYDLKKLNWFGLGGPAKFFFKPQSLKELVDFLKEFQSQSNLPIKVIGVGSNTLIRDGGYNGVIIKLGKNFSKISRLNETLIISGASVFDKQLSDFAMKNSISGFEFFSCIPGSIGGAIKMNAGCYDFEVSKCLVSIQVIDKTGIARSIMSDKINFFYRGSDLPEDLIFLSATFKGKKEDSKKIREKIETLVKEKKKITTFQNKNLWQYFQKSN